MPIFTAIEKDNIDLVKLILYQECFDPNESCFNKSPLYYAVYLNKLDIAKFLISTKKFSVNSTNDNILLFEYTISKNEMNLAEILLQQDEIKIIGDYSVSLIDLPYNSLINRKVDFFLGGSPQLKMKYAFNLVNFFIKNSNESKNQFVINNISFFACLIARYLDENDFIQFFEKYKVDINIINETTIFNSF